MNKLVYVLIVSVVGTGWAATYFNRQLQAEREQVRVLRQRLAELEPVKPPALPAPESKHIESPSETAPPPAPHRSAAATGAPPARPAMQPSPEQLQQMRRRQQELMEDPEYRKAVQSSHRMMLMQAYPYLARDLGMSPAETRQLFDLLARQQTATLGDGTQGWMLGSPPDAEAMRELKRRAEERQRANDEEIAALLGSDRFAGWQDYQRTLPARQKLNPLRASLDGTDLQLSEQQVESLVQVISVEQERVNAEMRASARHVDAADDNAGDGINRFALENMERAIELTAESHAKMQEAASAVLSAEQLQQFREVLDNELAMQRSSLQMMRARGEQGALATFSISGVQAMQTAPGVIRR